MKKILLSLSVLSILIISSCGEDDGGSVQVGLTGTLDVDGKSISITDGLFEEFNEDGAYAATFFLADSPISFDATEEEVSFDGEILINVIIYTTGDAFKAGIYQIDITQDEGALVIYVDENNASLGGAFASGGTVEVKGYGNTYTLTFDVDLGNEASLTGSVSGGFEIIDINAQ